MIMKKREFILGLGFLFVVTIISVTSCNKDDSNPANGSLTSQQAIQLKNADAQDAIADKTEEDIDNKLEELQNNNYAVANMKSYFGDPTDTVIITVDHPDTTNFPKVVTITYYSYKDSSANENIIKNGTITVTITRSNANLSRLVSRAFVFNKFSITTDSTTIILNGTRTVNRIKNTVKLNGFQSVRISVIDNIIANLSFAVVTTGTTDTLKFTRNVDRVRTAISWFINVKFIAGDPVYNLTHMHFRHLASCDTLTYEGQVTGVNENNDTYSKIITTPLIIVVYKGSQVISSGAMTYQVGTDTYGITFMEDPDHKHFTLVTVTNNQTGKSKSFDRKFGCKCNKWW
jgi:hypothetical protein